MLWNSQWCFERLWCVSFFCIKFAPSIYNSPLCKNGTRLSTENLSLLLHILQGIFWKKNAITTAAAWFSQKPVHYFFWIKIVKTLCWRHTRGGGRGNIIKVVGSSKFVKYYKRQMEILSQILTKNKNNVKHCSCPQNFLCFLVSIFSYWKHPKMLWNIW